MSKMLELKTLRLSLCALLFFFFLGSTSSLAYEITESQLATLESNLNMLAKDNESLKNMQLQSNEDLKIAQEKLKNSANTIQELQQQLNELKSETTLLQQSLSEADSSLKKAEIYLKQSEANQNNLERENKILKYLLIGLGVYASARR